MTLTAPSHHLAAQRRAAIAVLIMRLTLDIFLLLWNVGKLVVAARTFGSERISTKSCNLRPTAAVAFMGSAELALRCLYLPSHTKQRSTPRASGLNRYIRIRHRKYFFSPLRRSATPRKTLLNRPIYCLF